MADYNKWAARLRGEEPPTHEIEPELGFWRVRDKDTKQLVGVAIWEQNGKLISLRNKEAVPLSLVWPWCSTRPVSEDTYRLWDVTGQWPDVDPGTAAAPVPPKPGSNEPADPAEMLRDEIDSAKAGAGAYAKVASDEEAARAQSLRSRLLELTAKATKTHKELKAPHLAAGQEVDRKWLPMAREAQATADDIKRAIGVFETEKDRAYKRAQWEIEQKRLEAAEEARRNAAIGLPPPQPAPVVEAPVAPRATIKGGYGRAASVQAIIVIKGISDWPALFHYFRDDPDVQAAGLKAAAKAVRAGLTVPGVVTEEQRAVR